MKRIPSTLLAGLIVALMALVPGAVMAQSTSVTDAHIQQINQQFAQQGVPNGFVALDSYGRLELKGDYEDELQVDRAFSIAQTVVGVKWVSPVTPENIKVKEWEKKTRLALQPGCRSEARSSGGRARRPHPQPLCACRRRREIQKRHHASAVLREGRHPVLPVSPRAGGLYEEQHLLPGGPERHLFECRQVPQRNTQCRAGRRSGCRLHEQPRDPARQVRRGLHRDLRHGGQPPGTGLAHLGGGNPH